MTRDELISFYANEYAPKYIDASMDAKVRSEIERLAYKAGINSQLNKDLQKLDVIEGKIEVLKDAEVKERECSDLDDTISELETQRTELLNKLNLEG